MAKTVKRKTTSKQVADMIAVKSKATEAAESASKKHYIRALFSSWSEWAADACGSPIAFAMALITLIVWAVTGPIFEFSDTWQMVINTLTTIVTFLLVFIIQNSQNRETRAMQLKLNELLRATLGAHNAMVSIEHLSEEELKAYCKVYEQLAQKARAKLKNGAVDDDAPHINPIKA